MNSHFHEYLNVTWMGTLPPDRETGEVALFFRVAGNNGVLRLRMPRESADKVTQTIAYVTNPQFPKSAEIPRVPGSTPEEGQPV